MARELTRVTWPLPWWTVVVPGGLIAASVAFTTMRATDWAYVALARASGLPGESLQFLGPVVCVVAAVIAERFLNRHSPLAASSLPRAGRELPGRVLAVVSTALGATFALGAVVALGVLQAQSSGGEISFVEVLLSILRLEFFILTGFAIGFIVARWFAPILALAWSVLWVLVLPLQYAMMVPMGGTNLEYFLFPAVSAVDHRPLAGPVLAVVVAWSAVVLAAVVLVILGWAAWRSQGRAFLGLAGGTSLLLLAGVGLTLPQVLPSPFVDDIESQLVCQDGAILPVCVTAEQQSVLSDVTPRVNVILERMGAALPTDLKAVVSYYALPSALAQGYEQSQLLTTNIGAGGYQTLEFDIAVSLAGLEFCDPNGSSSTEWAFAFGQWLVPDGPRGTESFPALDTLLSASESTVLDWYSNNEAELRTCTYQGTGPATA